MSYEHRDKLTQMLSDARLRLVPKKTQLQIARALSITKSTVTKWETGKATPADDKPEWVIKIAAEYGIEPEILGEAIRLAKEERESQRQSRRDKGGHRGPRKKKTD